MATALDARGEATEYGLSEGALKPLQGLAGAMLAVAWIIMVLRLYVRSRITRTLGWDDGVMVLAMVVFTVLCTSIISYASAVQGLYTAPTLDGLANALECLRTSVIAYSLGNMFLKASLALHFHRFNLGQWQSRGMITATVLYWLYTLPWSIVSVCQCGTQVNIIKQLPDYLAGRCIPWRILGPLHYVGSVVNCVSDLVFLMIPVYIISRSKMENRRKTLSIALVGIGLLGFAASVARLPYVGGLDVSKREVPSGAITVTSLLEVGLGIMASSASTLLPLVIAAKRATMAAPVKPGKDESDGPTMQPIPGVGILSQFMSRTRLSTMTSAIHRRIRQEDFQLFAMESIAAKTEEHTQILTIKVEQVADNHYMMSDRLSVRSFEEEIHRV